MAREAGCSQARVPAARPLGPVTVAELGYLWSFLDSAHSKAAGNAFHWTSICARTCESIPETGPMCAPSTAVIRSLLSQLT